MNAAGRTLVARLLGALLRPIIREEVEREFTIRRRLAGGSGAQ